MRIYLYTLSVFFFFRSVNSLKIIALMPFPAKSHYKAFEPLFTNLVEKGHHLTTVAHFEPKIKSAKWKFINMGNFSHLHEHFLDLEIFENKLDFPLSYINYFIVSTILERGYPLCETLSKHREIKKMLNNSEKFDLVLAEQFDSDCNLGIAYFFNAPIIALQGYVMLPWTFDRFSQPNNPSYIPHYFLSYSSRMTFYERLCNMVFYYLDKFLYEISSIKTHKILEKNLNRPVPRLHEISKNTSLLLSNTHYTLNGVKPLVPVIVEVGGIHLKKTMEPLDKDIEKFMNESTDGVILFSMGSLIRASSMSSQKLTDFMEIFATLSQRVIWKWESDPPKGLTDNVMIVKWVQQMEILHHPKTVAFISHGGMLGMTEALHAGVPILCLPVFGDHFINSAAGEENGLGVKIAYNEANKENLLNGIKKILSFDMKKSAKSLSAEWKDRLDPVEVATAEIERVARHGGHRRRSPARDLHPLQVLLIDVVLFLTIIISVIIYVIYKCLEMFLNLCSNYYSKSKQNLNKAKNE